MTKSLIHSSPNLPAKTQSKCTLLRHNVVEHKCINGWNQLTKKELQIKDIKMLWKERAGLNYANEIIFLV